MKYKNVFVLSSFLSVIFLLSACADVAVTGVQAFYNRHAWKKNLTDQYITLQAYNSIHEKNDKFKNANIVIATFNSEVLLTGQAPEAWQRVQAEKKVKEIPNVKYVYNLVKLSNPASHLTHISDAWITTKVKAKLIASNDLDATKVKVVTEDGTVYLMGILLPEEADAAAELASTTKGVERVIKAFSYMHINKHYNV